MRPRPGAKDHICGRVNSHDLAVDSEVGRQGERRIAQTTTHVEQPLTGFEAQLVPLPCA